MIDHHNKRGYNKNRTKSLIKLQKKQEWKEKYQSQSLNLGNMALFIFEK